LMLPTAANAAAVGAQSTTGNDLLTVCLSSSDWDQGSCYGYIIGVTDAMNAKINCIPVRTNCGASHPPRARNI
jgi:hypothetical protein